VDGPDEELREQGHPGHAVLGGLGRVLEQLHLLVAVVVGRGALGEVDAGRVVGCGLGAKGHLLREVREGAGVDEGEVHGLRSAAAARTAGRRAAATAGRHQGGDRGCCDDRRQALDRGAFESHFDFRGGGWAPRGTCRGRGRSGWEGWGPACHVFSPGCCSGRRRRRTRLSSETASRITVPVANDVQLSGTSKNTRPLETTESRIAPTAAPNAVPEPPRSGGPPITAAAIACSSNPGPMLGSPEMKKARPSAPARPARRPISTRAWTRTRLIEMPENAAASGFDPIDRMR